MRLVQKPYRRMDGSIAPTRTQEVGTSPLDLPLRVIGPHSQQDNYPISGGNVNLVDGKSKVEYSHDLGSPRIGGAKPSRTHIRPRGGGNMRRLVLSQRYFPTYRRP